MYVLSNIFTPSELNLLLINHLLKKEDLKGFSLEIDPQKVATKAISLIEEAEGIKKPPCVERLFCCFSSSDPEAKKLTAYSLWNVIVKIRNFEEKISRQKRLVDSIGRPYPLQMKRSK